MKRLFLLSVFALGVACASAETFSKAAWIANTPEWAEKFEPFAVTEGVYYVGSRGLSSILIATPEGHFLIDGGLPENAAMIAENIRALGFDVSDVKYLLNSHAHFDHSGGLAALKKMSGATMVSSVGDRRALETGLAAGSEDDADFAAPPVRVDRVIGDGETLTLGGVSLTAHLTPGHTKGCTSWTMQAGGRSLLYFCSATVAANRLVNPPQYDGIVDDYRATFAKTKSWRPDIFLANHSEFFDMAEKRKRQIAGDADAFVDRERFPALMTALEAAFEESLAEQTAAEKE
jgi:metallo-beta-lactamase class B